LKDKEVNYIQIDRNGKEVDDKDLLNQALKDDRRAYNFKLVCYLIVALIGSYFLYTGVNPTASVNIEFLGIKLNFENTVVGLIVIVVSLFLIFKTKKDIRYTN